MVWCPPGNQFRKCGPSHHALLELNGSVTFHLFMNVRLPVCICAVEETKIHPLKTKFTRSAVALVLHFLDNTFFCERNAICNMLFLSHFAVQMQTQLFFSNNMTHMMDTQNNTFWHSTHSTQVWPCQYYCRHLVFTVPLPSGVTWLHNTSFSLCTKLEFDRFHRLMRINLFY